MSIKPTKIGIIGCGNISGIYFKAGETFDILEIAACADLDEARAREKADSCEELNMPKPRACSVDELLADPEIEIVINLTIPGAHAEVAQKTLEAGKHTHGEKPLTVQRDEGQSLLKLAQQKKLRVGNAPDTFMGAGIQTCRKLIDDGWIGEPVGAMAFMLCHGHESWHPDPEFYYKAGGGPMFDMGPYYLTALIALLGPVKQVTGATRITFPERTITSKARYGEKITVDVPTHVNGIMEFANGAIANIVTSFDVWAAHHGYPNIEIYGTEGSLVVPDPNAFGGKVIVKRPGGDWMEIPHSHGYADNSRGIGVADMAYALRSGREHRASGELAYHVLDCMHAFHDSADQHKHIELQSTCTQPAPLPLGLRPGTLDA